MVELTVPDEPVKIALIGCGNRARTIYRPLFEWVKPWVAVVAVCDPVREHSEEMAGELGVRGYCDIRELVRERPMEAGLIVAPVPLHHSISVYLSSNGVHNHSETSWCSMVVQGREMIEVARLNGVVVRVGENFFRFSVDRFAQVVKERGAIGRMGRVFSYADHTGYHNNSRWIRLVQGRPLWVQAVEHSMETPSFRSMPHRFHQGELFRARYFGFADDFLVVDQAANVKGWLGRMPRPGYTEWQGTRGTLMHRSVQDTGKGTGFSSRETQLRRCSDAGVDEERQVETIRAVADEVVPVVEEVKDGVWVRTYAETQDGVVEYVNPLQMGQHGDKNRPDYGIAVMDHLVDFALAVRGLKESEFDEEDALMSLMMDLGARESAHNKGQRVELPLEGELEWDAIERQRQKDEYGVDPLDVEGMLALSHRRP